MLRRRRRDCPATLTSAALPMVLERVRLLCMRRMTAFRSSTLFVFLCCFAGFLQTGCRVIRLRSVMRRFRLGL